MLKIAVFGNSKWSLLMKELLETEYSEMVLAQGGEAVKVEAFVVMGKADGETEISVADFGTAYRAGELFAIVIPKEYYMQQNDLVFALIREGVELDDIYDGMRLSEEIRKHPEFVTKILPGLLTPMLSDPYLPYLEFHVADHCNLNCKYCTHYSPLVQTSVLADYEAVERDFEQLKKYIWDIGVIRILGGEPLLNPELGRYVRMVRKHYPSSIITVVTNGLLLPRISPELIQDMKECMAFFHISYYPPLETRIQEIQEFLYEQGIPYTLTPMIKEFNKTQILQSNPDEDFFYRCFQATCTCLQDGKLAPCYAPFTTKYFNEAFDKSLPENEGIDLYGQDLHTEFIKASLLVPLERCRYCVEGKAYPWEVIGKRSTLEDWVEEKT